MATVEHTPDRPSWDCRACGRTWPCDPAREALRVEFAKFPTVLKIYLSGQMADAVVEIPGTVPADLHDRFLAWAR